MNRPVPDDPDSSRSDDVVRTPASSLRDRIVAQACRVVGSEEHLQFARLARLARPYSLDPALAAELALTVVSAPTGIERNLDVLDVPPEGLWIEWDDRARGGPSVAAPGTVATERGGALLCADPDDPDRLVMMTAWSLPDGSVRHSYAAVALSRSDLAGHAWLARNRFSGEPVESSYRLLMNVHVYIPPGLAEEMEVVAGLDGEGGPNRSEEAKEGARRDVTADAIFVMAAVLSLGSDGVARRQADGGLIECSLAAPAGRLRAALGRLRRPGFGRRGRNEKARVAYVPWGASQRGAGA